MAREMPVLPEVGSRIVEPGRSRPSFSACSTMKNAARSFTDPVGLRSSSLAHNRTSSDGDILVVQVDVDEPAEVLAVDQPVAQATVLGVQVGKQVVQGAPGPLHRLGA